MNNETLDELIEQLSQEVYVASPKLVYQARAQARKKRERRAQWEEWMPFVIVIGINSVITMLVGSGCIWLFADTLKEVLRWIMIGLGSMNIPLIAYAVAKLYYKEKMNERLREE